MTHNISSISSALNQGALANHSGVVLEDHLEFLLKNFYNFTVIDYNQYLKLIKGNLPLPSRLAIKSFPYKTIYGKKGKTEMRIRSTDNNSYKSFPAGSKDQPFYARFECKRQMSAGSVDEKFPYVVKNAEQALSKSQWEKVDLWAKHAKGEVNTIGYDYQEDWEGTFGYPEDNIFIIGHLHGACKSARDWLVETLTNRDEWNRERLPNKRVEFIEFQDISKLLEALFAK